MADQQLARLGLERVDRCPHLAVDLGEEKRDQLGDVAAPLAQRRDLDRNDVEPEKKILAEALLALLGPEARVLANESIVLDRPFDEARAPGQGQTEWEEYLIGKIREQLAVESAKMAAAMGLPPGALGGLGGGIPGIG